MRRNVFPCTYRYRLLIGEISVHGKIFVSYERILFNTFSLMSLVGITFSHMNWSLDSNKNKSFRYVFNRNNLWEKLFSKLSPVLNLKYRTCVMAKSLLKFIVKIVMTLLTHTVVKFLMDKNPHFILISAFYSHFSVLSPFQRFILISAFYPHLSVLSPFQFPFSVSVSAIQFQRFIPTPLPPVNFNFEFCYRGKHSSPLHR